MAGRQSLKCKTILQKTSILHYNNVVPAVCRNPWLVKGRTGGGHLAGKYQKPQEVHHQQLHSVPVLVNGMMRLPNNLLELCDIHSWYIRTRTLGSSSYSGCCCWPDVKMSQHFWRVLARSFSHWLLQGWAKVIGKSRGSMTRPEADYSSQDQTWKGLNRARGTEPGQLLSWTLDDRTKTEVLKEPFEDK